MSGYPHRERYRMWPGPNSNTFASWVLCLSAWMPSVNSRPASVLAKLDMSVGTTPGATPLTRMPRSPKAAAKCSTKVSMAPLVAA